jgi:hypothetical protein
MTVQVKATTAAISTHGLYQSSRLACEGQECTITIFTPIIDRSNGYINVTVHNAAQKAFRGMGIDYENTAQALAAYKNPKILAMINELQHDRVSN